MACELNSRPGGTGALHKNSMWEYRTRDGAPPRLYGYGAPRRITVLVLSVGQLGQAEAAGEGLKLLGGHHLRVVQGVVDGGDDEVLEHFAIF